MKKLFFIVCLLLTSSVILANVKTESDSDERFVLEKVSQVLHSIKSSKCRSDLNYTLTSLHNGTSWAIESKHKSSTLSEQTNSNRLFTNLIRAPV